MSARGLFWLCLVFVSVVLLGCGGARRIVRDSGAPSDWLEAIRIDGNAQVEEDVLTSQIAITRALRDNWVLDPYQVNLDTKRIRAMYLRFGFFDVDVKSRVDSRATANGATAYTVVFLIKEGRRAKLNVVITGLPPEVPMERARKLIAVEDGAPFNYEDYDDAKTPLLALIENAGYAHVTLDAAVIAEKSRGIATARYAFEPGSLARFGKVTIEGVTGDLATAIVNRLAFAEGEIYSQKALALTQRNLYELGRFSTVRIVPDRTAGTANVPVAIQVATGTRHEVKLGGGFGYEPLTYEARVRAGGSIIPLEHPLWTLGIDARVAGTTTHEGEDFQPKIRTLATASRMDLFKPRLAGELGVGFDYVTTEAFTSTGPLTRIGLSSPIGVQWLQARVGWQFSYSRFVEISGFIDESNRARFRLDEDQRIGAYTQTILADLRDDPIDPRKGAYVALRVAEAGPAAGSAFQYVQLTPDIRGYVPLGPMVIAMRVRAGAILGDVPVTERFFSGGAQSHRGFSERELAPEIRSVVETDSGPVEGAVLIGGAALLETGAELRIPFGIVAGFELGGTLFVDGGDVTADTQDLDPTRLHWAAGAGISAKVGGIKIRIDVGHRLNRTGPTEPQYEPGAWLPNTNIHFGVGDTF